MRNTREKGQKLYPYSIKIQSCNGRLFKQLAEKLKKLNCPILVYEGKNIIQFDSWYCTEKTFNNYLRRINKILKQLEPEIDRTFFNKLDVEDIFIIETKFKII